MNEHKLLEQLNGIQEQLQKHVFDQKEILNLTEAALFLCIAKSTLYKMTHRRVIPFHKPAGKLILFKRQQLLNWIEGNGSNSIIQSDSNVKEGRNGKV